MSCKLEEIVRRQLTFSLSLNGIDLGSMPSSQSFTISKSIKSLYALIKSIPLSVAPSLLDPIAVTVRGCTAIKEILMFISAPSIMYRDMTSSQVIVFV